MISENEIERMERLEENINFTIAEECEERMRRDSEKENYDGYEEVDPEEYERKRMKSLGYSEEEIEAEIAEMVKEPEEVYYEWKGKQRQIPMYGQPKKLKLGFGDDEEWKE